MATISWTPGAFAERHPSEARQVGRLHALQLAAACMLFERAGVVPPGAIGESLYGCGPSWPTPYPYDGPPRGCCGATRCAGDDTACGRGTCMECSGLDESSFEATYPDQAAKLCEDNAFAAAVRDILADPDVANAGPALKQAQKLAEAGELAALYAPAPPAKKLPDGSEGPARCQICLATVCPSCGCGCCCTGQPGSMASGE
jgi:hypothetical protein